MTNVAGAHIIRAATTEKAGPHGHLCIEQAPGCFQCTEVGLATNESAFANSRKYRAPKKFRVTPPLESA